MTVQITDKFEYEGSVYDFLYEDGAPRLFNPLDLGFDTYSKSSECWIGYMCSYKVENNELYLDRLYINSENNIEINGKKPTEILSIFSSLKYILNLGFDHKYKKIELELDYTGDILIGKGNVDNDFDSDYYDEECLMGPHSYEEVLKLNFKKGKLITVTNISDELDGLRKRLSEKYKKLRMNIREYPEKKAVNLKAYDDFWEDKN